MDKRYQVFVSSTYTDLIEERAEVMQALLELDCFPAGMELFPAANEEQWGWIKKIIDISDYYLVIIGARYGSVSKLTGLSFTEMEYRYAIEIGKPVIAFIHENPGSIAQDKSEASEDARDKLNAFKDFVQEKLCKYWNSPADLGAKVSRSITQLIKHAPAVGWIRTDSITPYSSDAVLKLKNRIDELEKLLEDVSNNAPQGSEKLSQGEDFFDIKFSMQLSQRIYEEDGVKYHYDKTRIDDNYKVNWNYLFKLLAPSLIGATSESSIISIIANDAIYYFQDKQNKTNPKIKVGGIEMYSDSLMLIKIQLRALGLIRVIKEDYTTKWELTPYGDSYMVKLVALHK